MYLNRILKDQNILPSLLIVSAALFSAVITGTVVGMFVIGFYMAASLALVLSAYVAFKSYLNPSVTSDSEKLSASLFVLTTGFFLMPALVTSLLMGAFAGLGVSMVIHAVRRLYSEAMKQSTFGVLADNELSASPTQSLSSNNFNGRFGPNPGNDNGLGEGANLVAPVVNEKQETVPPVSRYGCPTSKQPWQSQYVRSPIFNRVRPSGNSGRCKGGDFAKLREFTKVAKQAIQANVNERSADPAPSYSP